MRAIRLIPHVLLLVALATLLLLAKEWAYVATYRLYLDRRVDDAVGSTARQRFDLDKTGVVPRIVLRDERVSFRAAIGQDSTIRAHLTPTGAASFEIHLRQGDADRVVARGNVAGPMAIECQFPTGNGIVDIVSHGELTWSDLQLRRNLRIAPELWLLGILTICWLIWRRARKTCRWLHPALPQPLPGRFAWMAALTMFASVGVALLAAEVGLRVASSRLPSGISALRHDLGEPTEDPRWQSSPRYGRRLMPNVRGAENEWRDGDVIRMGFVPSAMSERRIHRYAFSSDGEGFRNAVTRDPIDVAALGDSFTDALTMAVESAWPSQLERRLGLVVQNYGTAGFGPQQERLVLQDFALTHHPRVVVLAFFAGNDIRDAERFEEFERGDHSVTQPTLGWPIRDVVIRADTWYLTSAIQAAARAATAAALPATAVADAVGTSSASSSRSAGPRFDRGVFTVPVNGLTLRWAFMPPYLNLLRYSEDDLAARRGWALAIENIRDMQRASSDAGARFVLMFIPFKSQVYLPLLERTFSGEELASALHFSLPDMPVPLDLARLSRNRLAQNALMRRVCAGTGIPFLDLTTALQERVEKGENMYFPDDSHLNEAGEALTAATLAEFLRQQGLVKIN
ncbi:MAG: GDSL-type esterase/lipase family protein [Acidobacteria bacterium]|nr:GDSL-type esterase/lipase family protein [Acidobacteriota bacterium]